MLQADNKSLALLAGLFMVAIGVVGIITPASLVTLGQFSVTPIGLYVVAALRVCIGLVLVGVSPVSRTPKTLRVFGIIAVVAGLTTPLVGADRAAAILHWWSAQGPAFLRLWAGLPVAFGGFILYVVLAGRRTA